MPQIYYYGNTYDDANAEDKSANMSFVGLSAQKPTSSDGNNYLLVRYSTASNTAATKTGTMAQLTLENTSMQAETYTAYFGFAVTVERGSTYKNSFASDLTLSDTLTVTAIDAPELDETSATYTGNDITVTVNDLDTQRVVLTKYSYKDRSGGAEQVKYTYPNTDGSTATGTDPLNGGNTITVKEAGTYKLEFDIAYWCGVVWNSNTNDQSKVALTFTVNPKQITKPTAPTDSEKPYTGSAVEFEFTSSLTNDEWNKYIKLDSATDTSGNAVTGVVDKQDKKIEITNAGTYTVKLGLVDTNNTVWADTPLMIGGTANYTLKIKTGGLSVPSLSGANNLTYDGTAKSVSVTGFDYRYMEMTVEGKNGTSAVATAPTITYDTYKYWVKTDGTTTETDPQDPDNYTETEGRRNYKISATSVGSYTVTFKLSEEGKKSFLWADGSADGTASNQTATFSIAKQSVVVPSQASSLALTYNTKAQTMQIRNAT
ncbi:MAG: hypothetical protein K2G26_02275, partial [Clostridia bacterium]|nr:hypothetical protein [Clostridia bacterium]